MPEPDQGICETQEEYVALMESGTASELPARSLTVPERLLILTYLLTLYTYCGRGTDFRVSHCRSEVREK